MAWLHFILLTLLPILLIIAVSPGVDNAVVKDEKHIKPEGQSKQVFVPASDASHFFKRRGRRSPKLYAEYVAEQQVQLAATERRREDYEEQRNEYENHVEEVRDEQFERNREKTEQYREYQYDGLYPRYPHHRPYV